MSAYTTRFSFLLEFDLDVMYIIEMRWTTLLPVIFCCLTACDRRSHQATEQLAKEAAATVKIDGLHQAYLRAPSAAEAKQRLLEIIDVIDATKFSPREDLVWRRMTTARLYVLCKRTGQIGEAEAYLVETRYYYYRQREIDRLFKENAGRAVAEYTAETIEMGIDKRDKRHTQGKGPAYSIDLPPLTRPSDEAVPSTSQSEIRPVQDE